LTVTLPKEKVDRIKDECLRLQKKNKTSIREVSRIIGILVSSFSAVDYGNLHYRILEKEYILMEYQQSIASHQYMPHCYAHTDVM
jgi:hypothetical protein